MEQRGSVSEGEGECKVQCGWMVSGSGVRFVNEDRDRNFDAMYVQEVDR